MSDDVGGDTQLGHFSMEQIHQNVIRGFRTRVLRCDQHKAVALVVTVQTMAGVVEVLRNLAGVDFSPTIGGIHGFGNVRFLNQ